MANYDEEIIFASGSDDGQNTAASIQPIVQGENIWEDVLNRSPENIRKRIEVLRSATQSLNYYADYDRAFILKCLGTWALSLVSSTPNKYKILPAQDLTVSPALTPGYVSGGRDLGAKLIVAGVPYVGTVPNELRITASRTTTGQRGFANGSDLATPGVLSVGADGISIQLEPLAIPGGAGSISAVVEGSPARLIKISYGTLGPFPTTAFDLKTWINADATSQGAYGLRHLIFVDTTTGSGAFTTSLAPTRLQGGYDAEAFKVTVAQFVDFFTTVDNQLRDGESLAIGFPAGPVETGTGNKGGRRQSLYDSPTDQVGGWVDNTTPSVGNNLFNTGREPEKIPGAIPIGKMQGGEFVFIDGTRITVGSPIQLGESGVTVARLAAASNLTIEGADLIGFQASPSVVWNAGDAFTPGDGLSSLTVRLALEEIVLDLAAQATNDSGSRRVGAEGIAGTASVSNYALSLAAGSIRQQLASLLNTAGSPGVVGGVNARVSEYGHSMHGVLPLEKNFNELFLSGTEFLRAQLHPHLAFGACNGNILENALSALQSLVEPGVTSLLNPIDHTAGVIAADQVHLVGMTSAQATLLANTIPATRTAGSTGVTPGPTYLGVVQILGIAGTGGGLNGYYYVHNVEATVLDTVLVKLVALNGSVPDFALAGADYTTATAAFYFATLLGEDNGGRRLRMHLPSVNNPRSNVGPFPYQGGSGSAPIAISGTGNVFPTLRGEQPLIDFFTPGGLDGGGAYQAMIWQGMLSARRAIWSYDGGDLALQIGYPAGLLDDSAIVRNTDNILIGGDATLLRGVERTLLGSGGPVDATANHHHRGTYTRTFFLTLGGWTDSYGNLNGQVFIGGFTSQTIEFNVTSATLLGGDLPLTQNNAIDIVAIILDVRVLANPGTVVAGSDYAVEISFTAESGVAPVVHTMYVKGVQGALASKYHGYGGQIQVPVRIPLLGTGVSFDVVIGTPTGALTDPSASLTVAITGVGAVLSHDP